MEVASSRMVHSSLSRYFLREVRSLELMPDTILVTSCLTGILPSSATVMEAYWVPVRVVNALLDESREVMSMPLLRICSGYSLRVERSISSM